MEWTDEAIVLAARRHGESSAIASLLTCHHGRHAGLVRGGAGRRARGILQPGNRVTATWRARLPEHLGLMNCEMTQAVAADLLNDAARLSGLSAACAVAEAALPERESHETLYRALSVLLAELADDSWPTTYVRWEMLLLAELGFGLDLSRCAATGEAEDLVFVSPRTGRAVSRQAGAPYRTRLLALPPFLCNETSAADAGAIVQGLVLTGYFLERHVFAERPRGLPDARRRLVERFTARAFLENKPSAID